MSLDKPYQSKISKSVNNVFDKKTFVLDKTENPRISFYADQPNDKDPTPYFSQLCKPEELNQSQEENISPRTLETVKKLSSFASVSDMYAKAKKKNVLFSMDVKQLTSDRRNSQDNANNANNMQRRSTLGEGGDLSMN